MKKSLLALMIATVSASGVQAYAADFSVQSSNQASNQANISGTTAEPGSAEGENRSMGNQAQADIASDNSAGLALTMDDVNVEQGVKQTIFAAVGLVNQQEIDVDKSNAPADAEQSQGLAVETLDGVVINLASSTMATMSSEIGTAADVTLDATHNLTADLKSEVETASAAVISGVEGAASAVKDAVTASADLSAELSSSMQAAVEQDTQTVTESISESVTANIDSSLSSQASGGLL